MMMMMRLSVDKMKIIKATLCVLLSALLIIGCAAVANAADSYLALYGFSFTINDNNEATIHEYDDRSAEVVIPNTLLGARVVCIDNYAFFGDTTITSLNFGNASYLNKIGVNAFFGCSQLKELNIPSNVSELSYGSFQNCSELERLVIEDGLTAIPTQSFYGCSALKNVIFDNTITSIGNLAFANCTSLTKLELPDSLTEIADNAFEGCDALVIYCTKESYALQYAIANEIDYVITNPDIITYLRGDANGDDYVTIFDATVIQRTIANLPTTAFYERAADIDNNGLDVNDATNIQRYLAVFSDPYHIGEYVVENNSTPAIKDYELPVIFN